MGCRVTALFVAIFLLAPVTALAERYVYTSAGQSELSIYSYHGLPTGDRSARVSTGPNGIVRLALDFDTHEWRLFGYYTGPVTYSGNQEPVLPYTGAIVELSGFLPDPTNDGTVTFNPSTGELKIVCCSDSGSLSLLGIDYPSMRARVAGGLMLRVTRDQDEMLHLETQTSDKFAYSDSLRVIHEFDFQNTVLQFQQEPSPELVRCQTDVANLSSQLTDLQAAFAGLSAESAECKQNNEAASVASAECNATVANLSDESAQCKMHLQKVSEEVSQYSGEVTRLTVDADRDTIPDYLDACPNSSGPSDSSGCDKNQFCSLYSSSRICKRADWKNDQPKGSNDCRWSSKQKRCLPR